METPNFDKVIALNDDFTVSPTNYEITTEDLVVQYTATKTVTRALAFVNGKWIYCTSFTDKTITFNNSDFEVGENSITVMDVNYNDGTYGRFTGVVTVVKSEGVVTPPEPNDNPPTIGEVADIAADTNAVVSILYAANDDNGIVRHELYDGSQWIIKEATLIEGSNYTFTHTFTSQGAKSCKVRVTDVKGQAVESNVFTATITDKIVNAIEVLNAPYSFSDSEKVIINYRTNSPISSAYLYGVGEVTNHESITSDAITFPSLKTGTYTAYVGTYINGEWCKSAKFELTITEAVVEPPPVVEGIEILNAPYSFLDNEKIVINYRASSEFSTAYLYGLDGVLNSESVDSNTITFPSADVGVYEVYVGLYLNGEWTTSNSFSLTIDNAVVEPPTPNPPTPPPVVDNAPTISNNIPNQEDILGTTFTISYTANDDNGIVKHELFNSGNWVVKEPIKDGNNYSFTIRFTKTGAKSCKVRVTDTKGQVAESNAFTITVNEVPVTNKPPVININGTTGTYDGAYTIKYSLLDVDSDQLRVSLKVDNGTYKVIAENKGSGSHTYNGTGLSVGTHNISLKVFDGELESVAEGVIIIAQKPTEPTTKATLYDKTGKVKIGVLKDILDSGYVEEVRNGIFDLFFDYPLSSEFSDSIVEENFVEVKPNDNQEPQKFRIWKTNKVIQGVISVFARHESTDIVKDNIDRLNLKNASCEYALNELFRNSHFSTDYRGFSDVINAQDYNIQNINLLNAIAGSEGSIIDTYGNGAEIYRNHKEIHVLNRRGNDNGVVIEYGKNLLGLDLEVSLEGLETRCGGFAVYRVEGSDEEIRVESDWIDSPHIDKFAHPYIASEGRRDYSDKFEDGVIPTKQKLNELCAKEFTENKRDIPTDNYRIEFIPLSKCIGYEDTADKISLCDMVTIKDYRFGIDTQAKVISYKYDFLRHRYISMELGEPKTALGDIIGGTNGKDGQDGKDGLNGQDGKDGNIEDFPHTLPPTPVMTATLKGFASIDLSWTFEDKLYYTYEVYASKTQNFIPNTMYLIHSGQTSSFLFQARPNETWYFKACCINSHGERTPFSTEIAVNTVKEDSLTNYFTEMAIGRAVVQSLTADYMEAGIIKGAWIDAKQLTVTDGNGKRTLDIDSFGRITADFSSLTLRSQNLETSESAAERIKNVKLGIRNLALNTDRYLDNVGARLDCPLIQSEIKKHKGKEITLSLDVDLTDVVATAEGPKRVGCEFWTLNAEGVNSYYGCWVTLGAEPTTKKERVYRTLTLKDEDIVDMGDLSVYIQGVTGGSVRVGRPKCELGNKVSDYTKAFEDVDENINVAYDRLQVVEEKTTPDGIVKTVKEHRTDGRATFVTGTEFEQTKDDFQFKFENNGKPNELINSNFTEGMRGWHSESYDADCWVEYSNGYNGVENPGVYSLYLGLWNGNGSCFARQIFKPRNTRLQVFTVGGMYHYTNVSVEREEPYPMAYIYLVIVNKDGTREYYNQDEVMRSYTNIGWVTHQKTFYRAEAKEISSIEYYVYKRSTSGQFRITNLDFHEGSEHRKWRPSGEIYSNTTKIDGEGIEIIHDNGSKSRFSHEKIEFTAPNGNAALRIKDGGLNMFTTEGAAEMVGFLKPSIVREAWNNGVSLSTYASGDYITIGHSESSTETSWATTPSVVFSKRDDFDLTNVWQGTNFVNDKVLLRTRTHLKNILDVDPSAAMEFYANSNSPHLIFNSVGANRFCLMGDNELVLGIREGLENKTILKIIESPYERVQNYHHWNFNNWTMWNMRTGQTLSAQSKQLRARKKDINDIYGGYSMTDGEIRYTCRETQSIGNTGVNLEARTIQEDRTLVVELPQILAENIENDYHINIGKISWGDYRIVEKTPYYFIIESNVDNFQFTYEIVAKRLFNNARNAVIASSQYDAEDAPEVKDEKIVYEIDNGQIGEGSFWKIYTEDFLKALEQQKMNTLQFTEPQI